MNRKIVWIDTETGGLDPMKHQLIQVAAIATTFDTLEEVDRMEVKLKLELDRTTEEALKLNSFDERAWEVEAIASHQARRKFTEFLVKHATTKKMSKAGRPYYIAEIGGQNVAFDIGFVRAWYGQEFLPADAWHGSGHDTMYMARTLALVKGFTYENLKLETLCKHFGVIAPSHDAMDDIAATVALAREMVRIFRNEQH